MIECMRGLRPLVGHRTLVLVALVLAAFLGFSQATFAAAEETHGAAAESHAAPAAKHGESAVEGVVKEAEGDIHAAEHEEATEKPELPNLISVLLKMNVGGKPLAHTPVGHFMHVFEVQIFMVLITVISAVFIFGTLRLRMMVPGKLQVFLEMMVEGFYNFFGGILGSRGKKYVPFVASLFMFIWLNNMFGLLPLMTGATGAYETTVTLAVIVFFYVQINGIREAGLWHWFHHLMGSPNDAVTWALAPFMLVLETIGELAKPLSLSLRLFGNMMGEHILSGVFLVLGVMVMGIVWPNPLVGVPLHTPFLLLGLLVGTIQALVFSLLSTIYLMLLLPHDDHGHGHEGEHGHAAAH
ncbi:MAG: F0F1 ATP synthase subunit A [Candidatus Sumerlaeaceae bacterium]|nr:F0F1 ATP synthase subunit A [Candidatus Sumerlaeaceae bacterium]